MFSFHWLSKPNEVPEPTIQTASRFNEVLLMEERKKDEKKETAKKEPKEKKEKSKDKKKPKAKLAKVENPWETLRFVLMTEKCVRHIELKNEITFIARRSATKKSIADAFETVFENKVEKVRTVIDQKGRKKAYIKLAEPGQAGEIAIKLGII